LLLTAVAFTMLQCPLTLAVQELPLFISTDLGGDTSAAGLILGLCATLEIPLMIGLGALAYRIRPRLLILAGSGCGIAYYTLTATATGVWVLAGTQVLNALFIAAVSGLGISYVQDMPQRPGQATTCSPTPFRSAPFSRRSAVRPGPTSRLPVRLRHVRRPVRRRDARPAGYLRRAAQANGGRL